MSESEGDFALSISSDMIAEVMEKHFNKEMFKKRVEIVDLKPTQDGYMFVLGYVRMEGVKPKLEEMVTQNIIVNEVKEWDVEVNENGEVIKGKELIKKEPKRNAKGRFTSANNSVESNS